MKKRNLYFPLVLGLVFLMFTCGQGKAAEVVFLGALKSASGSGGNGFPEFTLKQRIRDLFDFSNRDKQAPDRSGYLGGTVLQSFSWGNVHGNKARSFLNEGIDYLTELHLDLYEKLFSDYRLQGRWFLRKTDNPRIEARNDVRLKQMNLRVENPRNLFEFGDFYGDFSPFSLSSSLQGLNVRLSPQKDLDIHMVMARKYHRDEARGIYQRNVLGAGASFSFAAGHPFFSRARMGLHVVSVQDDSATAPRRASTKDIDNTVVSVDGDFGIKNRVNLSFEAARSGYVEDEDASPAQGRNHGYAFRLQPGISFGRGVFRYLFYYADPDFYTDAGSAMADKIQHQGSLDWRFNDSYAVSLVENYYRDDLNGSPRVRRTTYDEKYVTLYARPFHHRRSLRIRTYVNYVARDSDDPGSSLEADTVTLGMSLDDRLGGTAAYGLRYEYRKYKDRGTPVNSESFHRVGGRLSQEVRLFNRRFYYSADLNLDVRDTHRYDGHDVTTGMVLSGRYDLFRNLLLRFGHNLQTAIGAAPASDFASNLSYLELDLLRDRKRDTHIVARVERNQYNYENSVDDYRETLCVLRFQSRF